MDRVREVERSDRNRLDSCRDRVYYIVGVGVAR